MRFLDVARTFDKVESTSGRLDMIAILSEFFREVPPKDLRNVIYLASGRLHPEFDPREFGMADKLVIRAIQSVSGRPAEQVEKETFETGDPGNVAEKLTAKKFQMTLFSEELTFDVVIRGLSEIESASGKNSQDKKMKTLARLLGAADPVEARYLCRIVTGRMRVGAGTLTVIDALSAAFATREDRPDIERAYNITCDLGMVGEVLASDGLDAVRRIGVTVGNPIKVMLAERLRSLPDIMERMGGNCAFEFKYDGIRVQAHIRKDTPTRMFSRRLEDLSENFGDIGHALQEALGGRDAIVEGECVAVDTATGALMPFQNVTHRRRKNGMSEAIEKFPVRIFLFDLLYLDGVDYTVLPYRDRRTRLEQVFGENAKIGFSRRRIVSSEQEAQEFFDESVNSRCEGIMAKSLSDESVYKAGARGFLWIKYKKDYTSALVDTFDLAVVGAFYGMGKRAGAYGALLMAAFDPDSGTWCTTCKLGTGFDDAFLAGLPDMMAPYLSDTKPSSVSSGMEPDVWFIPGVVLEVSAADISISPIHTAALGRVKEDAGLGLRFPRFTGRIRDDKDAEQCTTTDEILEFYELQESNGGEERCPMPL